MRMGIYRDRNKDQMEMGVRIRIEKRIRIK